jgi:secreted trypsin-like serine protease
MAGSVAFAAPNTLQLTAQKNEGLTIQDVRSILKEVERLPAAERTKYLAALRIDRRIIGGRPYSINEVPYQVALVRGYATNRYQFCGGTLIAPDTVVTAAHCIDNGIVQNDPARLDIVAGTAFFPESGERIKARSIAVHPQWNSSNNDYDIAIIKLATPSAMGRPVPIDGNVVAVPVDVTVTGWGALSEGGRGSEELMGVVVPTVDTATCNHRDSYGGAITDRMLCAGRREGGLDSCQGDSGGPLVAGTGAGARLVGVVSFGEGCARELKYGVYTRVSSVAPWLASFATP